MQKCNKYELEESGREFWNPKQSGSGSNCKMQSAFLFAKVCFCLCSLDFRFSFSKSWGKNIKLLALFISNSLSAFLDNRESAELDLKIFVLWSRPTGCQIRATVLLLFFQQLIAFIINWVCGGVDSGSPAPGPDYWHGAKCANSLQSDCELQNKDIFE